jgi:hypothetical protein
MSLNFNANVSAEDNMDAFFDHLALQNKEFADLLKGELTKILQSSDTPAQRQTARSSFAREVLKILDMPPQKGSPK